MESKNWLKELKPGDKVVCPSNWAGPDEVATVERVTATLVVVGGGKYRIADGYRWGRSTYDMTRIVEATPARINEANRGQAIWRLSHLTFDRLKDIPTDSLEQALRLLTPRTEGGERGE